MNEFFRDNHKLVFEEWISPSELKGARVLDLGSQTGWLGEYCLEHGAAEYVGVEIDEYHIQDARTNYPNLTFFHMDLEDYVLQCVQNKKMFDIIVISRTIHGVHSQIALIQNMCKIANKVVLETGVPINYAAHKLLEILRSLNLTEQYKSDVESVAQYIEYEQPFTEYIIDERFVQPVPSTGCLRQVFEKLGFRLNLDTYESVKKKYPTEYGYDISDPEQKVKRSILKFERVSNNTKPLSWKEWNDIKDL